jgi:hypothetical protein
MKNGEADATFFPRVAYRYFTCDMYCSACDVREETTVIAPTTLRGSKATSERRSEKWFLEHDMRLRETMVNKLRIEWDWLSDRAG